jgi:hypothetical protein
MGPAARSVSVILAAPMPQTALFVSTVALIAALGCGGRENEKTPHMSSGSAAVSPEAGPEAAPLAADARADAFAFDGSDDESSNDEAHAPLPQAPISCLTQDQVAQHLPASFLCDFGLACALDDGGGLTCVASGPPAEPCIFDGAEAWCGNGCQCTNQGPNAGWACICGAPIDAGGDGASSTSTETGAPTGSDASADAAPNCMFEACPADTPVCIILKSNGEFVDSGICEPLPAACGGTPTCACLEPAYCLGGEATCENGYGLVCNSI